MKRLTCLKITIILLCLMLCLTACDDNPISPSGPDDETLSALGVSTGTLSPDFAAATINYSVSVAETETKITVTPTTTNTAATVEIDNIPVISGESSGEISLVGGINTIEVIVTAADGSTTKTYTISVIVGGVNMSGSLTLPNGEDATGKAFHLGLIKDFDAATDDIKSIDGTWSTGSTQDYQLLGVPAGSYYLYVLIDWNGDSDFDDSYPDYGGLSGFTFDSLAGMPGGGAPPGDANIIVAESNLTVDITDIQQIPAENGTVKVTLSGAAAEAGERFGFSVFTPTLVAENRVAQHGFIIDDDGGGEQLAIILVDYPNGSTYIGTQDATYHIFVMIDKNENDNTDTGEPYKNYSDIVMNGTIEISVDFADLQPFPPPVP